MELLIMLLLVLTFFHLRPLELNKPSFTTKNIIASTSSIQALGNQSDATFLDNKSEVHSKNSIQEAPNAYANIELEESNSKSKLAFTNIETYPSVLVEPAQIDPVSIKFLEIDNSSHTKNVFALVDQPYNKSTVVTAPIETTDLFAELSIDNTPALTTPEIEKPLDSKVWLNLHAGLVIDIIETPYDPIYNIEAYTQSATSNTIGASFSFYQNNVELESGFQYSVKRFQPEQIVKEISGRASGEITEASLQSLKFNMVSIPIQLRYHFAKMNGWHYYALGGTSLNIVAAASYDVQINTLGESFGAQPAPAPESKLSEKLFNGGVLEDGYFTSNSYFSLIGGVGIQKKISNQSSIFLESSYRQHLFTGGIGPNANKMHNLVFSTGVKTLLR
jgi:hypothetical protein